MMTAHIRYLTINMLEFFLKKKKWEDPFLAPSRPSYLLVSHVVRNVNYHCSEQHWQVAFESPGPFQFSPPPQNYSIKIRAMWHSCHGWHLDV